MEEELAPRVESEDEVELCRRLERAVQLGDEGVARALQHRELGQHVRHLAPAQHVGLAHRLHREELRRGAATHQQHFAVCAAADHAEQREVAHRHPAVRVGWTEARPRRVGEPHVAAVLLLRGAEAPPAAEPVKRHPQIEMDEKRDAASAADKRAEAHARQSEL
eukprot:1090643-Pleurochrysis_carterae.AAC.3